MRSYVIENWSDFEALEPEWNDLLKNAAADSIFLTWEWVTSWVEIHQDKTPYIIVIRDQADKLVGVAPLYHCPVRLFKVFSLKCLCVLGDVESGSDYLDFIINRKESGVIINTILSHLKRATDAWDLIWIPRMSGWNHSAGLLEMACKENRVQYRSRTTDFSSIELGCTFDEYLMQFSRKHREQIRRQERKVLKQDITMNSCKSEDEIDSYQQNLFRLNNKRWMTINDPGTFVRKPDEKRFYELFVPKAFKRGWLRYYSLVDKGEVKAIQLGYLYNNAFYQIQEGFDPEYIKGVGNVLRLHVIRDCINKNVAEYDFLGGYSEHKRRWGAKVRKGVELLIARNHFLPRMIVKYGIWPTGKYISKKTG